MFCGQEKINSLCFLLCVESGSLMDENFNPVRHLLEKHRYTTFIDLKQGVEHLKREVGRNDQAPIQFMRDNLDAFLQCYDTLSDILTQAPTVLVYNICQGCRQAMARVLCVCS